LGHKPIPAQVAKLTQKKGSFNRGATSTIKLEKREEDPHSNPYRGSPFSVKNKNGDSCSRQVGGKLKQLVRGLYDPRRWQAFTKFPQEKGRRGGVKEAIDSGTLQPTGERVVGGPGSKRERVKQVRGVRWQK